jgi:hypothetical protein
MRPVSKFAAGLFAVAAAVSSANAAVLISDTFPTEGNLVGTTPAVGGLWSVFSGDGGLDIVVTGGAASVAHGSGSREDVGSTFDGGYALGAGAAVYSSFELTVPEVTDPITSAYFAFFQRTATIFAGRLWVTAPAAGGYRLAVSGDASITDADGEIFTSDLAFGTTYTVVTKYDYDSGDTTLWVNPADESSPSLTTTDGTFSDAVVGYAFRQAGGNTTQAVDNLVVGTSFGDVIPEPASLSVLALGSLAMLRRRAAR